jgi:hypothetical protein
MRSASIEFRAWQALAARPNAATDDERHQIGEQHWIRVVAE